MLVFAYSHCVCVCVCVVCFENDHQDIYTYFSQQIKYMDNKIHIYTDMHTHTHYYTYANASILFDILIQQQENYTIFIWIYACEYVWVYDVCVFMILSWKFSNVFILIMFFSLSPRFFRFYACVACICVQLFIRLKLVSSLTTHIHYPYHLSNIFLCFFSRILFSFARNNNKNRLQTFVCMCI